jgi:hypothetical protein
LSLNPAGVAAGGFGFGFAGVAGCGFACGLATACGAAGLATTGCVTGGVADESLDLCMRWKAMTPTTPPAMTRRRTSRSSRARGSRVRVTTSVSAFRRAFA